MVKGRDQIKQTESGAVDGDAHEERRIAKSKEDEGDEAGNAEERADAVGNAVGDGFAQLPGFELTVRHE